VAVIDTSASMSAATLSVVSVELSALAAARRVIVVECDAAIQAVYPFRPLSKLRGRGGTDLRPPLAPSFLKALGADCVVYFTDGAGPAPERPSPVPVLWCLTDGGTAPVGWGIRVFLTGRRGV
jgi:predicted metal-dependent peptidase